MSGIHSRNPSPRCPGSARPSLPPGAGLCAGAGANPAPTDIRRELFRRNPTGSAPKPPDALLIVRTRTDVPVPAHARWNATSPIASCMAKVSRSFVRTCCHFSSLTVGNRDQPEIRLSGSVDTSAEPTLLSLATDCHISRIASGTCLARGSEYNGLTPCTHRTSVVQETEPNDREHEDPLDGCAESR